MLAQGYISQAEHDEAMTDDVYDRIAEYNVQATSSSSVNTYFTDALIDDVFKSLVQDLGYSESEAYKSIRVVWRFTRHRVLIFRKYVMRK